MPPSVVQHATSIDTEMLGPSSESVAIHRAGRPVPSRAFDPTPVIRARSGIGQALPAGDAARGRADTTRFFDGAVPCFTPGAQVATSLGAVEVERLRVGDLVQTADNGFQRVIWVGLRRLSPTSLAVRPGLRPIFLAPGTLGNERPILVSPQHRFLAQAVPRIRASIRGEMFVRACFLADMPGVGAAISHAAQGVTYAHFMTERHEVVFVDGVATETLYPGPQVLRAMPREAQDEIALLFPGLLPEGDRNANTRAIYGALARADLSHRDLTGSISQS